jgi:hypothetical protein
MPRARLEDRERKKGTKRDAYLIVSLDVVWLHHKIVLDTHNLEATISLATLLRHPIPDAVYLFDRTGHCRPITFIVSGGGRDALPIIDHKRIPNRVLRVPGFQAFELVTFVVGGIFVLLVSKMRVLSTCARMHSCGTV